MHMGAEVVSADSTVFAGSARNARLESNTITYFQRSHGRPAYLDDARRLVPENKWLANFEITNLSVSPIVNL